MEIESKDGAREYVMFTVVGFLVVGILVLFFGGWV